ncbi:MAG: PorP/SprF family type IX secretion system membrane protein [bacterium]
MRTKRIIILIIIWIAILQTKAQDANFMLYSNTALNINPAIIASGDDFTVSGNYQNKSYINDVSVQIMHVMLSRPLYKDHNRFGGFGFSVLSDRGGDTQQLIYEGFSGAYAHEVQLTSWSRLSLGLQAAYFLKQIDTKEFSTGSQWVDGVGYDPTITNGETFEKETAGNFTLNSGVFWYIPKKGQSVKSYLGFSMYNLTQPEYSFFGAEQKEPFKYVANAGYQVYNKGNFSIMPQALYYNSYNQDNWIVGAKWSYRFNVVRDSWMISSGSVDLVTDYNFVEGPAVALQVNQPGFSFGIGYGFASNFSGNYTPEKGIVEIAFSIKKSLYSEPEKQRIVVDDQYYHGQERKMAFKKPEKEQVVEKEKVNELSKDLKREPDRKIKFKLEKDFQFGFNEAALNEEAKSYIDDIVILLSENEMLNIEIVGHTDNVGTRSANQKISELRAEVVKQYLIDKGIDNSRIKTRGEADRFPLYENDTEKHRSMNRRVEFIIYY